MGFDPDGVRMHAAKRAAGKYGKRQDSLRVCKTVSIGNSARGPQAQRDNDVPYQDCIAAKAKRPHMAVVLLQAGEPAGD